MLSRNRPPGGSVEFVVLTEAARIDTPTKSRVAVSLAELGFTGEVTARDHWKREDIGAFRDTFGADIPQCGAGLYRITPQ